MSHFLAHFGWPTASEMFSLGLNNNFEKGPVWAWEHASDVLSGRSCFVEDTCRAGREMWLWIRFLKGIRQKANFPFGFPLKAPKLGYPEKDTPLLIYPIPAIHFAGVCGCKASAADSASSKQRFGSRAAQHVLLCLDGPGVFLRRAFCFSQRETLCSNDSRQGSREVLFV